jgi:hypothetical protein
MHDNQFITVRNNPTQYCQKNIKQSNNAIQNKNIWKYTNMNPTPPNATIKLHKPNTPIRPIISWKNMPI